MEYREDVINSEIFISQFVDILEVSNGIGKYTVKDNVIIDSQDGEGLNRILEPNKRLICVWDCTFERNFELRNVNTSFYIVFRNCHFEGHFLVDQCTLDVLEFVNSSFSDSFYLQSTSLNKLELENTTCADVLLEKTINSIELDRVKIENLYMDDKVYGSFLIKNSGIKKLHNRYDVRTDLVGKEYKIVDEKEDNKSKVRYKNISINFGELSGFLNLYRIDVEELKISGQINKDVVVLFKDFLVNHFELAEFQNDGKLRFHNFNLYNEGTVIVRDAQIGKTEFHSVDFSNSKYFQIYLSNLTEIITTSSTFPMNIVGRNENDSMEIREIYRQLKFAASKQGDRIKELEYEKYELINYEKTLDGLGNLKDRFILWSNRITNNHGQDYTITLFLWFIPLTLLMFSLIKINLGYSFVLGFPRANDVSQYLESALNPLHDFNKVFNDSLVESVGKARLYDSLLKIISGYLIFQFLRAFRKYVK